MENKISKKTVRSIIDELWEKNTVLDERKIRWFRENTLKSQKMKLGSR